jgi:geranyl-CoA carboxylase alpha subunit
MSSVRRITKLLIANRGEIACRILRSAHTEGLRTAAIYSDVDRNALHARLAGEAHLIGGAAAADSYLRGGSIVELAQRIGANAIHPGYGFLSEHADFAAACEAAGLIFVGPSSASMRALGNKSAARRLALALGIPVRAGYDGHDQTDGRFLAEARNLGFPLMVKAAAGGGGRGMRIVHHLANLPEALASARAESLAAFGSAELLLEALLEKARHIEIQIIADRYGKVLALHERDCTTQRRHQKILEEAPAPGLSTALRSAISHDAIRLARAVDYHGAGTVEFLLEPDGRYTLLEMNTRLQVEHPVTEAITGLDLVCLQLRIAQGEPLAIEQHEVQIQGHAVEARLCAEDPLHGCLPQSGPVHALRWPRVEGVRIDHGLQCGGAISPHYDPLMAKIIAWGANRGEAINRLKLALEQLRLLGPQDNRALLLAALAHPGFGEVVTSDVGWLERALASGAILSAPGSPERGPTPPLLAWSAAAAALIASRSAGVHGALMGFQSTAPALSSAGMFVSKPHPEPGEQGPGSNGRSAGRSAGESTGEASAEAAKESARLVHRIRIRAQRHQHTTELRLRCNGPPDHQDLHCWTLSDAASPQGAWLSVAVPADLDQSFDVLNHSAGETLQIGPHRCQFLAHWTPEGLHLDLGICSDLAITDTPSNSLGSGCDREGTVRSSMHGLVASVEVKVGDRVQAGSLLMRIEAMKIQHRIEAPRAGLLRELSVQRGQQVSAGQVLATIGEESQAASAASISQMVDAGPPPFPG